MNNWDTEYVSATILFDTADLSNCVYNSSAPYQTNGLNAGTSQWEGYLSELIDGLRNEAAQRLFDMHATAIIGPQTITEQVYQFGAQA